MQRHCKDPSALPTVSPGPSSLGTECTTQGTKGPIACQAIGEAQSHARGIRLPGRSIHQLALHRREDPQELRCGSCPVYRRQEPLVARNLADESSAASAFLDLSLAARKLRLRTGKRPARVARGAWCSRGSIRPRQSSLTFSRPRANRGLTPWHQCCSRHLWTRTAVCLRSTDLGLLTPGAQATQGPTYYRGHLASTISATGRLG